MFTLMQCKKRHNPFSALPYLQSAAVVSMLTTPQTQVANAACLPAPDGMVQNYHAIWLWCGPKKKKKSACTSLVQFEPIQNKWAQIVSQ